MKDKSIIKLIVSCSHNIIKDKEILHILEARTREFLAYLLKKLLNSGVIDTNTVEIIADLKGSNSKR